MCGISGIFDFGGRLVPETMEGAIGRMTRRLAHRGPDAEGVIVEAGLALGHRRLSVIDVSETGAQPMNSACGRFVCVFNGTIYNYREMRAELVAAGYEFRGSSDTEVLLEAFARDGDAVFDRIDGMYAIAIYDRRERELTLARDRAGEKPLCFAKAEGMLIFASELEAFEACPLLDLAISREAVAAYLTFRYVPAPHTIFTGVHKLKPGTVHRVNADGRVVTRSLPPFHTEVPAKRGALVECLEDALVRSVMRRFEAADVPIGLFLSGGIDSALVAALAAKHTDVRFTAFTFAFDADPDGETEAAKAIARHLDIPHETILAGSAELRIRMESIGTRLDEPLADRSCLPFEWLCETVGEAVKVAVGGDGGDELFLGYDRYFPAIAISAATEAEARALTERYLRERLAVIPLDVVRAEMSDCFGMAESAIGEMAGIATGVRPGRLLADMDFASYLPGAVLAKVDRMSMRHGLEVRTPFLSSEIIALAGAVPVEIMAPGGIGKSPLRTVLDKYLPPRLSRRPKQGFGIPAPVFEAEAGHVFGHFRNAALALARAGWLGKTPESNKKIFDAASRNINGIWALVILHQWMAKRGLV